MRCTEQLTTNPGPFFLSFAPWIGPSNKEQSMLLLPPRQCRAMPRQSIRLQRSHCSALPSCCCCAVSLKCSYESALLVVNCEASCFMRGEKRSNQISFHARVRIVGPRRFAQALCSDAMIGGFPFGSHHSFDGFIMTPRTEKSFGLCRVVFSVRRRKNVELLFSFFELFDGHHFKDSMSVFRFQRKLFGQFLT